MIRNARHAGQPRHQRALASLALLLSCLVVACEPAGEDYLEPDTRERVEALKIAAQGEATSVDSAFERADVLWEWANAYSLSGGHLPVMLPGGVYAVRSAAAVDQAPSAANLAAIDSYIAELTLKDEDPEAVGTVAFAAAEPLVAGTLATVEQVFTVGSVPMQPGGRIALGVQLITALFYQLQIDDPGAENYVTIRSSDPDARFEKTRVLIPGVHGAWRSTDANPAFELKGTTLQPGATVTVTYGDTSGGGPGLTVQFSSTEEMLFPLYIDLDGSGLNLSPRWPGLTVVGGEITDVSSLAPSAVAPNESFEISVRAEDRWRNRATGPLPAWDIRLDGESLRRIEANGEALSVVSDLSLSIPGVYRFEVVSEDGRFRTATNPVVVRFGGQRVAWGETHVHSALAEGQGTAEEVYRYAVEDARLDFLGYSEHDTAMDDGEWATLQRLARENTVPGRFAAFAGYEWTVRRDLGGHHNVFFRTPDHDRVSAHEAPLLPDLYRGLHASVAPEDVIVIPHAHQAADWTRSDPELERVVEIYSMHGTWEWFGNLYLQRGWRIGFIGASDDHRAKPGLAPGFPGTAPLKQDGGLAAVWVPEHTPDTIFDSLRSLRTYATSGQRIVLAATLNGAAMGTQQEATAERRVAVDVNGTSPIERIDVVRNGEIAFSRDYMGVALAPQAWVQVGFESSTVVYNPERDNPRPYRPWRGSLEVQGARLVAVEASALDNLHDELVRVDDNDSQRVVFSVNTRGRRDGFLLRLEGASAGTTLVVHLEEATEFGFAPVLKRQPATIPAADIRLPFSRLSNSRLEHPLTVDVHTDLVTLHVLDPEGSLDQRFEWTDMADPGSSDYYYVRVTQLDGGRAWTSPFWVGASESE